MSERLRQITACMDLLEVIRWMFPNRTTFDMVHPLALSRARVVE